MLLGVNADECQDALMGSDISPCVDCGKAPPPTETAYTLIGSKHGWRLVKRPVDDDAPLLEWWCADCWRKQRLLSSYPPSSRKMAAAEIAGESSSRIRADVPAGTEPAARKDVDRKR